MRDVRPTKDSGKDAIQQNQKTKFSFKEKKRRDFVKKDSQLTEPNDVLPAENECMTWCSGLKSDLCQQYCDIPCFI